MRRAVFRRSMIGAKTLGGVEYPLAVANLTFALMMVLAAHLWLWVLAAAGFHGVLAQAYRADPDMRRVYARYVRQGVRYEPWAGENARNRRPVGFGR